MDSLELAKALSSLPLTVLLVLVLVGGYTGWWIYGSIHRAQMDELTKQLHEEQARADKWEARYLNEKQDAQDDRIHARVDRLKE
jgi:cbb3-type cytochrome oxidase subunit 3